MPTPPVSAASSTDAWNADVRAIADILEKGNYTREEARQLTAEARADAGLGSAPSPDANRLRTDMALIGGDLGAWELFFDTGRTIYTERWAEILGYELHEVENNADFFFDLVHPEDGERVREGVKACVRGDQDMLDLVIRMRHRDGSWRWILDRGRILEWNDDGTPYRMAGTHMDITEQKRAREALRRERDLLENIFEASPVAISVYDASGAVVRASKQTEEMFGLLPQGDDRRRYDHTDWEVAYPDGTPTPPDELPFAQMMSTGQPVSNAEHLIRLPNGTRRLLSISGAPLFSASPNELGSDPGPDLGPGLDGTVAPSGNGEHAETPIGAVFVLHDITESRRAQDALQRSEERFRAVAEQAIDVIAVFSPDGTFQYLSPSVERVTGYPREKLVHTDGFAPVHPDDVDALRARFEQALRHPNATVEAEARYQHRDGSWRDLAIRGRQVQATDDNPQILANVRDVTYERARERELIKAKQKAEESSRLKSAMLANVSHEIRTPLTSILGFAEVLDDAGLDEPLDRFARLIFRSGTRLLRTLDAILDLSQLKAMAVHPQSGPVDLHAEITTIVDEFRTKAEAKDVTLHADIDAVHLQSDADILYRILSNLIGNAVKFTPAGGRVSVRCRADHDPASPYAARLVVEDTGIGMDPTFADRAFDAFEQESTGNARTHEGSGLGLALVKQYVNLLDADIDLDSEKDRGTTVSVSLKNGESYEL